MYIFYRIEIDFFLSVCRMNNSIPHVRKQLQSLWRRKVVNLLFEDLLIISESENNDLKNKDDKGLSNLPKICSKILGCENLT